MYFPILVIQSPFPFLGVLDGIFHFYSKFKRKLLFVNSGEPDQTLHFAASDLVLHCLPMSHKKDDMLIWVNLVFFE